MMAHPPTGRSSAVSRHEIAVPHQEFSVVFAVRRAARGVVPPVLIQAAPGACFQGKSFQGKSFQGKSVTLPARRGGEES
jgi:hypothetical protein